MTRSTAVAWCAPMRAFLVSFGTFRSARSFRSARAGSGDGPFGMSHRPCPDVKAGSHLPAVRTHSMSSSPFDPRRAAKRRSAGHGTGRRGLAALSAVLLGAGVLPAALFAAPAGAAQAPVGQGFTITPSDLSFILDQIKIAEHHAYTQTPDNLCGTLVGNGPDQIPSPLISKGLRTVDGSCNNLIEGQGTNGSADQVFPRISSKDFRDAEPITP